MTRDDLATIERVLTIAARRQDLPDAPVLLPAVDLPAGLTATTTGVVVGGRELAVVLLSDLRWWLAATAADRTAA